MLGSELEAALEELRLIRELRPPANARVSRPERSVYLRRRGGGVSVTARPTDWGPLPVRRKAELAARALSGAGEDELDGLLDGAPLPRLRARIRSLAAAQRYEDAARLRDRVAALEWVVARLRALDRLRRAELVVAAPAAQDGFERLFVVAGGRVADAGVAPARAAVTHVVDGVLERARAQPPSLAPEDADLLLLVSGFLRRPPPELRVRPAAAERRAAA